MTLIFFIATFLESVLCTLTHWCIGNKWVNLLLKLLTVEYIRSTSIYSSCLVSTKRSLKPKQTCNWVLQVCLSMSDLLLNTKHQRVKWYNQHILHYDKGFFKELNSFSTNVPLMDKPGSLFLLAKCLKNTCRRVTF